MNCKSKSRASIADSTSSPRRSPQCKLKSQRNRILGLLLAARGAEVSLGEILALGVAQFGSRILELRALGFKITNRQESRDGQHHSFYRLEPGPSMLTPAPAIETATDTLFPDMAERHWDLG